MKKLKRNNIAKNKILKHLIDKKSSGVTFISKDLNINLNLCFVCFFELQKDGYLDLMNTTTRDGKSYLGTITELGNLYINDGGYPSSFVSISIKGMQNNITTITSIIAIIISFLGYWNTYKNDKYSQEELVKKDVFQIELKKMKTEILDSIKKDTIILKN